MKPYYDEDGFVIYHGDSREVLEGLSVQVDVVITDPPYSSSRPESEFAATDNIAAILHTASTMVDTMFVFGTSSGRGVEFIRSSIRGLPHKRILVWHREYVNSPAAGPWRWDLVLIHGFGKATFGRPQYSSLIQTPGTKSLAIQTGHKAPVPVSVMSHIYSPFAPGVLLDPFAGSGSSLVAAKRLGGKAIGIEANEKYCEGMAIRLSQKDLFDGSSSQR